MKDIEGKAAFVTGGSSGIGLGIAKALSAAGMRVAIGCRRPDNARSAIASVEQVARSEVRAVKIDVTARDSVKAAAEEVGRYFGELHLLCNSAGVNVLGPMDEAPYDDWDWVLGVNLGGIINCLVEFLPIIKKHGQGGHVVNVASMASFITGPAFGVYATSKFAVRGLTESLRYSLARHKIAVSLLCPGLTKSSIYEAALHRRQEQSNSLVKMDKATVRRFASSLSQLGMDADELGRKTLEGILENRFYIFSHPEFRDELHEVCAEILEAIPLGEPEPKRMVFERARRKAKDEARVPFDELQPLSIRSPGNE